MNKIYTFFLLSLFAFPLSAQEVVSVEDQGILAAFVLNLGLQGAVTVDKDVRSYKLTYTTTDPFGMPDTATGLFCLPVGPDRISALVVYNHGTVASPDLVPSSPGVLERFIPQAFAGRGFIAIAPDYLGLGGSDGIHPYLHAETEASAGRDMVLAVKSWLFEQDIEQNGQLFVTGYSQGGHASMALHSSLEANNDDGLDITAAAHLSGAYTITPPSPGLLGLMEVDPVQLSFFINTVLSYNFANNLYGPVDQLFNEPYLTEVNRFVNQEINLFEMGIQLDSLLRANSALLGEMFNEQFVLDVLADDPDLVNAWTENTTTTNFAPDAPTLLYYCNGDMTVSPSQSINAAETLRANGADSIFVTDGGALDHGACAVPAAVAALNFFEARYLETTTSLGEVVDRLEVSVYPNPVVAGTELRVRGLSGLAHPFTLYDFTGRVVTQGTTSRLGTLRVPFGGGGEARPYLLKVGMGDGTSVVRRVVVR